MKRLLFVMLALVFTSGVCTLALQAAEVGKQERLGDSTEVAGAEQRTVSDGPASISVNSFGKATVFQYGGPPNHLVEVLHFVSVNNGPVQEVSGPAYTVECDSCAPLPLMVTGRTSYSAVQRMPGDLFIEFYNTIVDNGDELMDWYIEVYLYNLTERDLPICYYPYVDLNLFGMPGNDMATVQSEDPDLGLPSFRVRKLGRDALFVVADLLRKSAARLDSFEMKDPPEIQVKLRGAQNCIELPNERTELTGHFSGAGRYMTTIPAFGFTHVDFLVSRLQ